MRRSGWSPAVFALMAIGVVVAGPAGPVAAAKAPGVTRDVVGQVAPANAPGQTLILERVEVAPGAAAGVHFHEGTQLVTVRSGTLRYEVTAGAAEVTRRDGSTETLAAPGTTRLAAGDVFVERAATVHAFRNPGRHPAVLELAALLADGAPLSTPLGAADPAVTPLRFTTRLTSQSRSLFTVGPDGIDTFGWNRLSGAATVDGEAATIDFLSNVDYERGNGAFFGFFVLTWPDGSTLGVSGGTGRYVDATGTGMFTGYRSAALGGTVDLDVVLDLRPRPAAAPS